MAWKKSLSCFILTKYLGMIETKLDVGELSETFGGKVGDVWEIKANQNKNQRAQLKF